MILKDFATKQRLKTRQDDDLTDIIPGKRGHIYEYDDSLFGVIVMPRARQRQYWGYARRRLTGGGCKIVQDGDHEGAATFDAANHNQIKAAMMAAGIHRIRLSPPPSPAQEAARERFARMSRSTTSKGTTAPS